MWQKFKRRFLNPPRRIRLTPDGWKFLVITFLLGFAAINTGTNALYLLSSMLLSLIIASGILSDIAIKKISITLATPRYIFARRASPVYVKVSNGKKKITSFLINIKEDKKSKPELFFPEVAAGETKEKIVYKTFEKRGFNNLHGYILSTFYPFSIFEKYTPYPKISKIVVFPAIKDIKEVLKEFETANQDFLNLNKLSLEQTDEFQQVREYVPSDSSRIIHWKKSTQKLMSKKFETSSNAIYSIIFDRRAFHENAAAFEESVEITASLAYHFAKNNITFSFYSQEFEIKQTKGEKDIEKILKWLALTTPLKIDTELVIPSSILNKNIIISSNDSLKLSGIRLNPALKNAKRNNETKL